MYIDIKNETLAQDILSHVNVPAPADDDLIDEVTVQDDYDADKEGTYEFIYRVERASGEYGITKLVVVVQ